MPDYVQLKNWYPQHSALTRLERNLLNNSSRLHGNQTKVPCEGSQVYEGVAVTWPYKVAERHVGQIQGDCVFGWLRCEKKLLNLKSFECQSYG